MRRFLTPLFLSQGLASLSFFLFTVPSLGVILTKTSQLNTTTFDYVIVGGNVPCLFLTVLFSCLPSWNRRPRHC